MKIINVALADHPREKQDVVRRELKDTTRPNKEMNTSPFCPKCNNAMVKRTAKQGANAGKEFWGCPKDPKCKNIIAINT
ncbi:MAG: hypothetical protein FP813_00690 [Desulfurivibrio sp.]|nr:hypothetical protein [Desulfurivibrio sp.]MBU3914049.1 topoisomerase DNA-binding C4 zinc finger domain-containing protein [bacterium]MBU4117620.1 topoisomerase DNA-binding C4 zinc finger domain-containing protein [Pseudomonadota bacterium]